MVFLDNDFEVFLDPDGDTHRYAELEINHLGTVWDLRLEKPYRDGEPAVNEWDVAGLRSGVFLEGTLNNPTDRDTGWTVELAIPWAALDLPPPRDGAQWRVNFSRVGWELDVVHGEYRKRGDPTTGRPLAEANWVWSPQFAVNMHMPEMWGIVQFSEASNARVREPPDEPARWSLRRVYYGQRGYHARFGRYAGRLADLGLRGLAPGVWLEEDDDGYEAGVTGPTGADWRVRQDGRLWSEPLRHTR